MRLMQGSIRSVRACATGYSDEPQFAMLNPTSVKDPAVLADETTRRWAMHAQKSTEMYWARFPKLDRIRSCHIVRDSHPTTDPNPSHSKDEL